LAFIQHSNEKQVGVTFADLNITVLVRATDGTFWPKANWIERLCYREEERRGESSIDDCYQPGYFEKIIPQQCEDRLAITALGAKSNHKIRKDTPFFNSTESEIEILMQKALSEKASMLTKFCNLHCPENSWLNWLLLAAEAFVVAKPSNGKSLVAGYHWFGEWGRDAFISMPGLLLTTGRFEEAKRVLLAFGKKSLNGLIPNLIDEANGMPAYNTVDASLWYVNSVLQYLKYTGDFNFVQDLLWATLKAMVDCYEKGTEFGIHLDIDGLIAHDPQLTWMDAIADGVPVTPRAGKAVEVQALWYNTLRTMKVLANKFGEGDLAETYDSMAKKAKKSFNLRFWNREKYYLFDVLNDFDSDDAIRPNQVIAISLDFPILDTDKVQNVVDIVQHELLTPFGLRTLSPADHNYKRAYSGDRQSRDLAYHNGTVWPWLLGPFVTAYRKAKRFSSSKPESILCDFLQPLLAQQICEAGLGTISEVFDADPPHIPRGCISQAWSVAEPLRAYIEDCVQIRPRYEKILEL
jgi:predicted glycogen debranching enzyme